MAIAKRTCVSFCTFWRPLASPVWTIAVNVTWMERGFNAGQTHSSIIIPIYLQPFTSYSEILVGNCNFFVPLLHLTPQLGVFPLEFREKFGPPKTRIMGLPGSEDSLTID